MSTLNPADLAFLCGMGAGVALTVVLLAVAFTVREAARALREGSDDE